MKTFCSILSVVSILFAILAFFTSEPHAAVLYVPDDYATITNAMAAAAPGYEIRVSPRPGQPYVENVILKAGVRLTGSTPEKTIIQSASSALPVIRILTANQTYPTEISGFKITGGDIGIKCDVHDFNFIDGTEIVIAGNWITDNTRMGIDLYTAKNGPKPHLIINNVITRHRDAGIILTAVARVINNTISHNGFPDDGRDRDASGIVIASDKIGSTVLYNNNITYNEGVGLETFFIPGLLPGNPVGTIEANNFYGNDKGNTNISRDIFAGGLNISQEPAYQGGNPFNYMPVPSSPCVDRGLNSAYNLDRFPLDYTQNYSGRIYNSIIDIGAIEYAPYADLIPTPTPTPTRTATPTVTPLPTLSADFNRDGYIDAKDLFLFMQQWQSITPTPQSP